MSPEQARGKPVDKRTDIWAFGCVLFEMLTVRRAFHADEISDTLAFVLTKEPDWSTLPMATPAAIHRLLRRCLDKDRRRRLADIADARLEIDDATRAGAEHGSGARAIASESRARRLVPWFVAAGAAIAAAAAIFWSAPWKATALPPVRRVNAAFGANVSLNVFLGNPALVMSPDGSTLVFAGQVGDSPARLFVRRMTQLNPSPIDGTEGAFAPFFSPDGQWVGYFASGKLRKVPVIGGASIALSDAANPRGGTWGADGTIVFAPTSTGPLSRVAASGGEPQPITTLAEGEVTHRWPQLVDDGKALLFTASRFNGQYEDATTVVQRLPRGPRTDLLSGGYYPRYARSGHLLYVHSGTLFAAPVDLRTATLRGASVPVVEGISAVPGVGSAEFDVASDGTLVYTVGLNEDINAPLLWLDSRGTSTPMRTVRANWGNPRFSPDGRLLALNLIAPLRQLWVYDWARDAMSQLTFDPATGADPIWSPDGRDVAFASRRGGDPAANLYVQHADGSGQPTRLTTSPTNQSPTSWHPSGKFLALTDLTAGARGRIMVVPLEGDSTSGWKAGQPTPLLDDPRLQQDAAFSPDGRWIAYSVVESSRPEIFVQPFPGPGKWKVSADTGGRYPVWSRTGRELMFLASDGFRLMAAAYAVDGGSFRVDKPRVWGQGRIARLNGQRGFDLHPDGTRVVVPGIVSTETPKTDTAVFVFNFFDELRRIAPPAVR